MGTVPPSPNTPPMTRTTRAGRAIAGQNTAGTTVLLHSERESLAVQDEDFKNVVRKRIETLTPTDEPLHRLLWRTLAKELRAVARLNTRQSLLISYDEDAYKKASRDLLYFFHQWAPKHGYGPLVAELIDAVRNDVREA